MIEELIEKYPSKAAFCRAIGISQQYLRQIEKGIRPISAKTALSINKVHGTPLFELRPDIYIKPQP